jgi:hypothetical protein
MADIAVRRRSHSNPRDHAGRSPGVRIDQHHQLDGREPVGELRQKLIRSQQFNMRWPSSTRQRFEYRGASSVVAPSLIAEA